MREDGTSGCTGHAYIAYKTPEEASLVIDQMNNGVCHDTRVVTKQYFLNLDNLDNKGSCWILLDFYCSVTMLRALGLSQVGSFLCKSKSQVLFFSKFCSFSFCYRSLMSQPSLLLLHLKKNIILK